MALRKAYTIGFTQRHAQDFFETLKRTGIKRLIDVRLNNTSQIAGFAKRDDLRYFLRAICGAEYLHELLLAPTQEMLDAYKKNHGSWAVYEQRFLRLMTERQVERRLSPALFDIPSVLLCSENKPEHCHRRLVLEYLNGKWSDLEVVHL
ncbi:MAG: DUF488 domain-containing protein [Chloroflexota bacterium]|nr:DUF488 domain-containing protein [Chloroflexota bacterium]